MTRTRQLRRIRGLLALLAGITTALIVAACRFEAVGRLLAASGVVLALIAWAVLLELEGRLSDRLQRVGGRSGHRPAPVRARHMRRAADTRRAA